MTQEVGEAASCGRRAVERRRFGLDAINLASWFQGLCAVTEWNSLLCEWQAIRSEDVALVVGRGSLVMTRGDVSRVSLKTMWSQFSSWRYEVVRWSVS